MFNFLKQNSASVDVFCFQEVINSLDSAEGVDFVGRPALWTELKELLPDFNGYFEMTSKNHDLIKRLDINVEFGQAIFVKKNLKVITEDCVEIFGKRGDNKVDPSSENLPAVLQRVELLVEGKKLQIYNFHGITYPGEKLDTQERLFQSAKILETMFSHEGSKILCGDFNLTINTQSVDLLGAIGRDLIKEFKIENTRNEISWGMYQNKQHFADFTFVSKEVEVKSFEVPYNLVSDHLPMILEFEV